MSTIESNAYNKTCTGTDDESEERSEFKATISKSLSNN